MTTPYSTLIKNRRLALAEDRPNTFSTRMMACKFCMHPDDYEAIEEGRMRPSLATAIKIGVSLGIPMLDAKQAFYELSSPPGEVASSA